MPTPLDAYLDGPYRTVPGMSSLFAARIATALMAHQTAAGITGDVFEIGTYKGRFFVALALALAENEHAVGLDHFEWPDATTLDQFLAVCARHGVPRDRFTALKADSRTLSRDDLAGRFGPQGVRFAHVDGEHTPEHLTNDLTLAHRFLSPQGLMCLDDMLHPAYPLLPLIVDRFLTTHPDLTVVAVIDREDIVAAPKYLIGRRDHADAYRAFLTARFAAHRFILDADFGSDRAPILTPEPKLAIL